MKAKRDSKSAHLLLLTGANVASVPSGAPDLPPSGAFQASGVLRASWARSALWKTSCEEIKIYWTLQNPDSSRQASEFLKRFYLVIGDTLYLALIMKFKRYIQPITARPGPSHFLLCFNP